MSKQGQIEELKKTIVDMHTKYEGLNLKLIRARQDATAMGVRQIQGGSVPVGLLRNLLRADYEVVGQEESHHVFHLHVRHDDPIEKALIGALLAPEKPKFATGGYVPAGPTLVGDVSLTDYFRVLVGDPFPKYYPYTTTSNRYFNGGRTA